MTIVSYFFSCLLVIIIRIYAIFFVQLCLSTILIRQSNLFVFIQDSVNKILSLILIRYFFYLYEMISKNRDNRWQRILHI
jgi:hypothetical protein